MMELMAMNVMTRIDSVYTPLQSHGLEEHNREDRDLVAPVNGGFEHMSVSQQGPAGTGSYHYEPMLEESVVSILIVLK
jgi:hypothetical protein